MTTAADPEQLDLTNAERVSAVGSEQPASEPAPRGLTLLPAVEGSDVGMCVGGACRLPGA